MIDTNIFDGIFKKLGGVASSIEDSVMNVMEKLQGKTIGDAENIRRVAQEGATKSNAQSFYSRNVVEAKPWIESASKAYNVPQELLGSIYDQESSSGTVDTMKKVNAGNEGWRMGITRTAVKELERNKIAVDLSTPEGAVNAAAAYLNLKRKKYAYDPKTNVQTEIGDVSSNPQEWYLGSYADPAERGKIEESFNKRYSYYKEYFDKSKS